MPPPSRDGSRDGSRDVRRCAVLGSPVHHSLSPALHRAAYDCLGLDWSYDAVEVAAGDLAGFLSAAGPEWRGLSLTMPLKRTVMDLADTVLPTARLAGAANTLVLERDRRVADNTDVPGAAAALAERGVDEVGRAVVLGGGATAASVLLALAGAGLREAVLLVRDPARAGETARVVSAHPAAPAVRAEVLDPARLASLTDGSDLLVSTVPATAQEALVPALAASAVPAVFEVVYDPWPTPLQHAAADSGRVVVEGLDLLVHQAALQVLLMTGESVPVEVLREAGAAALAGRAGGAA